MQQFVVLIRGINVGGKNPVSMPKLRELIEQLGYSNVRTYINSGNVLLKTNKSVKTVKHDIEKCLTDNFSTDSKLIKVLPLSEAQLRSVINDKPASFGDEPTLYHSDAIFLIDLPEAEALKIFAPREGIDTIWPGNGVIYSQRLSAERTKSRLGKIIGTIPYQSMTIRSWNTVLKLAKLLDL